MSRAATLAAASAAGPAGAAWLLAGAAVAVTPVQVVHAVHFEAGSAALTGRAGQEVASALQSADQLGRLSQPGAGWFQLAGFAPGDAALAAGRAAAVHGAPLRAGAAPGRVSGRVVVLGPGAVPDASPSGPDRVEIALCPAAGRRCPPR